MLYIRYAGTRRQPPTGYDLSIVLPHRYARGIVIASTILEATRVQRLQMEQKRTSPSIVRRSDAGQGRYRNLGPGAGTG
jgi:hypothetical protein